MQARWRGAQARTLFSAMTDQEASAIMIRSLWRDFATCTAYKQKRAYSITVQSIHRGLSLRREIRFFGAWLHGDASGQNFSTDLMFYVIPVQSVFRRRSAIIQFHMGTAALSRSCNALRKSERLGDKNVEHHRRHVATACLHVNATNSMHYHDPWLLESIYCNFC
jgi:hypothetical protein